MRLTTKLSGIVAVGGVAALGAGLISSGGIGAVWTDAHTAALSINAGTVKCDLSSSSQQVQTSIETNGGNAEYTIDAINASVANTRTAPLTVKNSGTIPAKLSWSVNKDYSSSETNLFALGSKVFDTVALPDTTFLLPGEETSVDIGFTWQTLPNAAQGRSAHATFRATCSEPDQTPSGLTPFYRLSGLSYFDSTAQPPQFKLSTATNSDGKPTAGIYFDAVSANSGLPAEVPGFTASSNNPAILHLQIRLSDGTILLETNGTWSVSEPDPTKFPNYISWFPTDATWLNIQNDLPTGVTVQRVYIQAQGDNFSGDITCIKYGATSFGDDC